MKIKIISLMLLSILTVTSCQNQPTKSAQTSQGTGDAAPAEANLTQNEAQLRKQLISEVSYILKIELDEKFDRFRGHAVVNFKMARAEATFLDFRNGAMIESFLLNGQKVEALAPTGHRLFLPANLLKQGSNRVEIVYSQAYSRHGRGLHRFQDPEDKRVYLYTQFEAFDANQMFPCFDQPDLKAKLNLEVLAPKNWEVISTTRENKKKKQGDRQLWTFPTTPSLSTYLFSLHAGPYHVWTSKAGSVPLRLFVRQSLAKYVHPEDWFKITRQGLRFFGDYFAIPYPFVKYDQLIVPDFNAGAMENVAAVTFSEFLVHRGGQTRADRENLADIILHEMAHMWFGDLVTMKWWNGLWLNESFATFMSSLAMDQATEFKEAWFSFGVDSKGSAYRQDQLVTTHPIDGDVLDTNSAFANFDGITYGKGAAVQKQLRFYLGDRDFRDGVRLYFVKHAYSNTELSDFIGALEQTSKKDLKNWAETWLRQAGLDSVKADYQCEGGKISRFALKLAGPDGKSSPRIHRTLVALSNVKGSKLALGPIANVLYKGETTDVAEFIGKACPDLVDLNHDDQDYVKVQLDDRTLATLRTRLGEIPSAFTRARFWSVLFQMVRDAQLKPQDYLNIVLANFLHETDIKTAEEIADTLPRILYYLPGFLTTGDPEWTAQVEDILWSRLQKSAAGSDWQKLLLSQFVDVARSQSARDRLMSLLSGSQKIKGLPLDTDRRWKIIVRLVSLGEERVRPFLAKIRTEDGSERGVQSAMAADAAWPNLNVKREWLAKLHESPDFPFSRSRVILWNFLPTSQDLIRRDLADSYYANLPTLMKDREIEFVRTYASTLVPMTCRKEDSDRLEAFKKKYEKQFPPAVLKSIRISVQENDRCVRIRALAGQ